MARAHWKLLVTGLLLFTIASAAIAVRRGWLDVPPAWNPWAPLEIAAEPGFWTRYKLDRLTGDATLCTQVLRTTTLTFEPVPDQETGPGCGFTNAVMVQRIGAEVGEPFSVSCRTAVSLAMWEIHALQPAAMRYFGERVARIEHFGSYSCRNVYGRPEATRSRHATAEAWDVAGFVLEDGRRVRLVHDWQGATPEAAFLRAVRDGACSWFDAVLSPDYNAAHRDHLHLDRGPWRMCR